MVRILHISECYAGGVRKAIATIVQNLPEHEHHLLWHGDDTPEKDEGFTSIVPFRPGFFSRVRQVREMVNLVKPDVLHLHSSWAGAYGRLLPQKVPVIYEPHAYILSKPDLPIINRVIYHLAERYFALHSDMVIALSEDEVRIAKKLSSTTPVTRITNVASVRPKLTMARPFPDSGSPVTVVMSGRISTQKDPRFFLRTAELVHRSRPDVRFAWIGEGSREQRKRLESKGVRVTGWLESDGVEQELQGATLYFHSASYEGFPLSLLDAAAFSLPIVARRIPALQGLDVSMGEHEVECSQRILEILSDESEGDRRNERSRALDAGHSLNRLIGELTALYAERLSRG